MKDNQSKLFFIVNPNSGNDKINWKDEIENFYTQSDYPFFIYELHKGCESSEIKKKIKNFEPTIVVAAGGDGTVKLVAELILGENICMGILPAGSANGMAKELNIPLEPAAALALLTEGNQQAIHLLKLNNDLCIHLSDTGFNAFVVKKFEEDGTRGQWSYIRAAWKALWSHKKMIVNITTGEKKVFYPAVMVVLANATRYGNGVVINPKGSLYDHLFEIIIIKKISFVEIFKMRFTHSAFNKEKTQVLQVTSVTVQSKRRFHFQVDGEYRGKIRKVEASLLPERIKIMVPF
ncbi:MAG: diacylglycerol kinase family protein [Chitinophagaceae bacterium]